MNIDLLIVEPKDLQGILHGFAMYVEMSIPEKIGLFIVLVAIMIFVINALKKKIYFNILKLKLINLVLPINSKKCK